MVEGKTKSAQRGRTGLAALLGCCLGCSLLDDLDGLSSDPIGAAGTDGAEAAGAGGETASGGAAGAANGGAANGGAETGGVAGTGPVAGSSGAAGSSAGSAGTAGRAGSAGSDAGGPAAHRIFWLEQGNKTLNAANVDGTGRAPLVTLTGGAPSSITGIAVEPVGAKVYFSDARRQRVQSADMDGASLLTLLPGLDEPVGINIDALAGKLYVAVQGLTPALQRANLDGTGLEPLITTGILHPAGLALDVGAGKLYFVDDSLDAVFSASLDGSNLTNLNIAGVDAPIDISFDPLEGKLYWSELGAPGARIRRANLDGSGVEDIVTTTSAPGFSTPHGLEVDVDGRVLYFVDGGVNGSILRANLDGSAPVPVLLGLNEPTGLTLQ